MRRLFGVTVLWLSFTAAAFAGKDAPLIELPETAEIRFNGPYLVTSQAKLIEFVKIDLKGTDFVAQQSRKNHGAAIQKLRELKNFESLEYVYCFVDFNHDPDKETLIKTGDTFSFRTPDVYGSPTKSTTVGKRITLDTEHESTLSASFEAPNVAGKGSPFYTPLVRRLYCSFKAEGFAWGTDFVSEMKISHLEILLAPYFELRWPN